MKNNIQETINKEYSKWKFKESDRSIFLGITILCFAIGTYILFQIEVYYSYTTDWWVIPFGIGIVSLFFFILSAKEDK